AKTIWRIGKPLGLGGALALPLWLFYFLPSLPMICAVCDPFAYFQPRPWPIFSFVFGNIGDLYFRFLWGIPVAIVGLAFFRFDESWKKRFWLFTLLIVYPIALQFYTSIKGTYWIVPRQF